MQTRLSWIKRAYFSEKYKKSFLKGKNIMSTNQYPHSTGFINWRQVSHKLPLLFFGSAAYLNLRCRLTSPYLSKLIRIQILCAIPAMHGMPISLTVYVVYYVEILLRRRRYNRAINLGRHCMPLHIIDLAYWDGENWKCVSALIHFI